MRIKKNKEIQKKVFDQILEKDEFELKDRDEGNYLVQTIESLGIIKK